jgi:Uma2 family endonuclease
LPVCSAGGASTEHNDRGEKLDHYKQIESLREIILVAHDSRLLAVWKRLSGAGWVHEEYRGGATAKLTSIDCELSIADVYANA